MAATARQAAVIGGNRIPFARSNGEYFEASNQDMLTTTIDGLAARFAPGGERAGQIVPEIPRNEEPRTGMSMGEHAAVTAEQWEIGREEQDELAATSHQRMGQAWDEGFFDDLVTPYLGLERDNNLRPDSTAEKLAKLKPVFGDEETGTMTAGNSTPLTDGASAVLLSSD